VNVKTIKKLGLNRFYHMSPEELLGFLRSRRSSKMIGSGNIPFEDVVKVVEAGTWAANAHNAQPWRFIVVKDTEIKEKLLEEMGKEWLKDLMGDGLDIDKAKKIVEHANARSRRAAYLIIACLVMKDMDVYWDSRRWSLEYLMAVQSVAAAVQNMLLAIHALGHGGCWRCSPLFAPDAVKRVLALPDDCEPMAMVEIGVRGGETSGNRKILREIAFLNRWGEPLC